MLPLKISRNRLVSFRIHARSFAFTFLFASLFTSILGISSAALLFAGPEPTIGYAFPAGGQRGTTFRVILGGRQINGAEEVCFSGPGITAKILKRFPTMAMRVAETSQPARTLYQEEYGILKAPADQQPALREEMLRKRQERLANPEKTADEKALMTPDELAEKFPYFEELLRLHRPEDVQRVYWEYFFERPDPKPKETINQGLLLEVTIAPDAPCGDQWLSLRLPNLKTAPILFQIGDLPELLELEPNDSAELPKRWNRETRQMESWAFVQAPTAQLPIVWNGQIRPGDLDRFRFEAKKGQKLVLAVVGRRLSPFLADAVPGWFQPILRLFDPNDREIGNSCCWKNDPDPVLILEAPADGVYSVEIQDSLFRGRDDFVYRLAIGELAWVNSIYPPCAEAGKPFTAHAEGTNLPDSTIQIPNPVGAPNWDGVPMALLGQLNGKPLLHPLAFTVEKETPQEAKASQEVSLPSVFYGRLEHRGQTAEFRFNGKKGERVTLDVTASALESPLDARLELFDASGKRIAENDDRAGAAGPNVGLRTHHSDPLLGVTLPEDGTFCARLSNTLYEENPSNIYRIRIARTEPTFLAFASRVALPFSTVTQLLELEVVRLQGFEGPLEVFSVDPNLKVDGGRIPADQTHATCTVTALEGFWPPELGPEDPKKTVLNQPLPLRVRSVPESPETETNPETSAPANDSGQEILTAMKLEQAFIYFHLIPTGTLTASFRGLRKLPYEIFSDQPITLSRDGETEIVFCPEKMREKDWKPKKWKAPGKWLALHPGCEGIEIVSQEEVGARWKVRVRVTDPEKAANCRSLIFEIHWFKPKFRDPAPGETPESVMEDPTALLIPKPEELGNPVGWLPAVPVSLSPEKDEN